MKLKNKILIGLLLISLTFPVVIISAQEGKRGLLFTGLFTNSFGTADQNTLGQNGMSGTFNLRPVWTYDQTDVITGPLGIFATLLGISNSYNGLEEPLLSQSSGYQEMVISHSAGTRSVVSLTNQGNLWGEELYLVSPALISQNDLRISRDLISQGKGFKKIVVYTGDDMIPDFQELSINFKNYAIRARMNENFEVSLTKVVYEDRGQKTDLLKFFLDTYATSAQMQLGKEPLSIKIYGAVPGNNIEVTWSDNTVESFNLQKDRQTGEDFQDEEGITIIPLFVGFPHGRSQLEFLDKFYKKYQRMPGKDDIDLFKQFVGTLEAKAESVISVARDPNELSVFPKGMVRPGDKLTYTIDYENEGEGIAFGVYIIDTLEDDLDDTTLLINDNGVYNKETRTLSWFIGELGSRQQGKVTFSVKVKEDAQDKAEVINFATVYFPSVPETTRTNGVVNKITTNFDLIAPLTIVTLLPLANTNNWNNADVDVSLVAKDNEEGLGIKEVHYKLTGAVNADEKVIPGGTTQFSLIAEGITNLNYFSIDNAQNAELEKSQEIKLDKTLPILTANTLPQPNSYGWNNSDVTVNFNAQDSLSGVANVTPTQVITIEGKDQYIGGEALDFADNKAIASVKVSLDKTPPQIILRLNSIKLSEEYAEDKRENKEEGDKDETNWYELIYSAADSLSGLKNLRTGLAVISIAGFKQKFEVKKEVEIEIDEKKQELKIEAPDPKAILRELQGGLFLLNSGQCIQLKVKQGDAKWKIKRKEKGIEIQSPTVIFKAIVSDYADNIAVKELEFKEGKKGKD